MMVRSALTLELRTSQPTRLLVRKGFLLRCVSVERRQVMDLDVTVWVCQVQALLWFAHTLRVGIMPAEAATF